MSNDYYSPNEFSEDAAPTVTINDNSAFVAMVEGVLDGVLRDKAQSDPLILTEEMKVDPVNHPPHYTAHPSGIECIQITEHMGFCLGNAVKYIWRADLKNDAIEDLRKAVWYIEREIAKRTNQ